MSNRKSRHTPPPPQSEPSLEQLADQLVERVGERFDLTMINRIYIDHWHIGAVFADGLRGALVPRTTSTRRRSA
jgi:hypothetical protein